MDNNINATNEEILAIRQRPAEKQSAYWSEDEKKQLELMFSKGVGVSEMAVYFKRSETAIFNQIELLKLFKKVTRNRSKKKGCRCPGCGCYSSGKCTMGLRFSDDS